LAAWLIAPRQVKDGVEYAEKMRELTPSTKDALAEGMVGRMVTSFKAATMEWLESKDSFRRFKRTMRAGFGDLQDDIKRRPSAGPSRLVSLPPPPCSYCVPLSPCLPSACPMEAPPDRRIMRHIMPHHAPTETRRRGDAATRQGPTRAS
jgi:hypothetical protein